jgi:hypothetical protein
MKKTMLKVVGLLVAGSCFAQEVTVPLVTVQEAKPRVRDEQPYMSVNTAEGRIDMTEDQAHAYIQKTYADAAEVPEDGDASFYQRAPKTTIALLAIVVTTVGVVIYKALSGSGGGKTTYNVDGSVTVVEAGDGSPVSIHSNDGTVTQSTGLGNNGNE